MMDFTSKLPEMKSGNELISALSIIPEYDESICTQNQAVRLMALSDLYQIYVPSQMSIEIYNKLYLALLRSMQKKGSQMAIKQRYENYKAIQQQSYSGILGGSDSFTIIGTSGIGKSSAISRAISLITENRIIETEKPYTKIIPFLTFLNNKKGKSNLPLNNDNRIQINIRIQSLSGMLLPSVSVSLEHHQ